ncbi:unnamed protein product [Psylliodes chrysocephalus]|uniref:Uncharacterized protein n=1 Tax=Psylliodes chrysocephalus TaxID=3402493 RepID=A0A9P0CJI1_9CUCU|nr:unnamed protein product [Psylliodes chrysocephala]
MKNTEKEKDNESTKKKDEGESGSSTLLRNPLMELEEMGQEDMGHLENMKKTLAEMLAATKKQPNISQVVKAGLTAMVELCDALVTQEKKRTLLQNKLKEEVEKLPKWSPSKKGGTGSRKRRKEELADFSDSEEEELIETEIDGSGQVVTDSDATSLPERTRFQKSKQDLGKENERKAVHEAKREAD